MQPSAEGDSVPVPQKQMVALVLVPHLSRAPASAEEDLLFVTRVMMIIMMRKIVVVFEF